MKHNNKDLQFKTNTLNIIFISQYYRKYAILLLSFFHLLIIISSNYLVQLPLSILGLHTTWGAFSFPLIFLITDLTVRILGLSLARRVIMIVMIPSLLMSYVISCIFYHGGWQGWAVLEKVNLFVLRIANASFIAYVIGQTLDAYIFNRLYKITKRWIVAPIFSIFIGNISDTLIFFFIAFYRSTDVFMSSNWIEIALIDCVLKVIICIILILPIYKLVINTILDYLSKRFNVY